ncbi:hypothetical protein BJ508DRAFT_351397 [Ascobolus immersus RN42]|uniref:Uncharacterized protein n=1 Tax=Ascobolus immersus RN42 TaxID=1160509 RepID=A0A3N4HUB5_ASCIM|nr:hypothetical protein BJ508DRAFT_351397 [Ascobolus immersus RN42]
MNIPDASLRRPSSRDAAITEVSTFYTEPHSILKSSFREDQTVRDVLLRYAHTIGIRYSFDDPEGWLKETDIGSKSLLLDGEQSAKQVVRHVSMSDRLGPLMAASPSGVLRFLFGATLSTPFRNNLHKHSITTAKQPIPAPSPESTVLVHAFFLEKSLRYTHSVGAMLKGTRLADFETTDQPREIRRLAIKHFNTLQTDTFLVAFTTDNVVDEPSTPLYVESSIKGLYKMEYWVHPTRAGKKGPRKNLLHASRMDLISNAVASAAREKKASEAARREADERKNAEELARKKKEDEKEAARLDRLARQKERDDELEDRARIREEEERKASADRLRVEEEMRKSAERDRLKSEEAARKTAVAERERLERERLEREAKRAAEAAAKKTLEAPKGTATEKAKSGIAAVPEKLGATATVASTVTADSSKPLAPVFSPQPPRAPRPPPAMPKRNPTTVAASAMTLPAITTAVHAITETKGPLGTLAKAIENLLVRVEALEQNADLAKEVANIRTEMEVLPAVDTRIEALEGAVEKLQDESLNLKGRELLNIGGDVLAIDAGFADFHDLKKKKGSREKCAKFLKSYFAAMEAPPRSIRGYSLTYFKTVDLFIDFVVNPTGNKARSAGDHVAHQGTKAELWASVESLADTEVEVKEGSKEVYNYIEFRSGFPVEGEAGGVIAGAAVVM